MDLQKLSTKETGNCESNTLTIKAGEKMYKWLVYRVNKLRQTSQQYNIRS